MNNRSVNKKMNNSLYGTYFIVVFTLLSPVVNAAEDISVTAESVYFDSIFFGEKSDINLMRYSNGNPVTKGKYRLDVLLNETVMGPYDIKFDSPDNTEGKNTVIPCLSEDFLRTLGVSGVKKVIGDVDQHAQDQNTSCIELGSVLPGASYDYDQEEQRLLLSIPQIYLQQSARGAVSPSQWESGINAGMLDYNLNTFSSSTDDGVSTSVYTGLQAGLNLANWHLRHLSNLSWANTTNKFVYQTSSTYLERDITPLRSQIRVGDISTQGGLFQGINLRGVSLFSDDRMLPDSLSGYAPTIRGVANSNAKISVVQNGQTLYQTTVAPGPFEINDLYPTSYAGDLIVNIEEANGSVRVLTVPYSSLPQLLRPGAKRFSWSAGQYNDAGYAPLVTEATYQRGLTNNLTGFIGVQASERYQAVLLGNAFNTRLGAFSLEMNHSRTTLSDNSSYTGSSYRAAFSKLLQNTDTNFTLAAHRYSTSGYLNLPDAMQMESLAIKNMSPTTVERQKNRFEATINQVLPYELGSIYLTGSSQQFWNSEQQSSYSLGYNTSWQGAAINLSYQNSRVYSSTASRESNSESYLQLSLSMAFGQGAKTKAVMLNMTRDGNGNQDNQLGISGSLGESGKASYFSSMSYGSSNAGSLSLGGSYQSNYGNINATSSVANRYKQASFGLSGGVVAYSGGVKFGPQLGSTFAIIEAPGAEGAKLNNSGSTVGKDGVALATNLLPYRLNTLAIDPEHLPMNVQLDNSVKTFAPRAGSVSLVKFKTTVGRTLIIDIKSDEVPFGAEIIDEKNNVIGIVGQGGRAVLLLTESLDLPLEKAPKTFLVKWGNTAAEHCTLHYSVSKTIKQGLSTVEQANATCLTNI